MSKLLNDIVKAANNTTLGKLNITDTATMDKVVRNIKTYDENIQNLVEAGVKYFKSAKLDFIKFKTFGLQRYYQEKKRHVKIKRTYLGLIQNI